MSNFRLALRPIYIGSKWGDSSVTQFFDSLNLFDEAHEDGHEVEDNSVQERAAVRAALDQRRRGVENSAFASLYQRHVRAVYRYLLAYMGDSDDAHDLTAQTFIAALTQMERFRGEARFSTWLIGIARHKALDHDRRNRRSEPLHDAFPSQADDLDTQAGNSWQIDQVITALHTLAPDRQEAILLHIFARLSVQETAVVMGRSRGAVYALLERGLDDLRMRFNIDGGDDERTE